MVNCDYGRQPSGAPSGVTEKDTGEDVPCVRHHLRGVRKAGVRLEAVRQSGELREARREATRREARRVPAQNAGGRTTMTTVDPTPAKRKAKKRPDGDGSIRYSESKKLWIGRVMVGYRLDGKPDVREVKSKQQGECKRKLDAVKAGAQNKTLPSADAAGLTVSAFLDRWLATVKTNLREKTHRGYSQHVEVHCKPALGTKRIAKLSHDDIQAFLNAKRDEKKKRGKREVSLSPRSLHSLYVVLGTALNWAVKKGYIPFSPMLRVDAPRVPATEITPLTLDQTRTLLAM